MTPSLAASTPEQDCQAFLSFLSAAVGLLLPLAALVKTEPPASLRAWEDRARRSGAAGGGGSDRTSKHPVLAALRRASDAVEGGLRQLCGRSWLAVGAAEPEQNAAPADCAADQPAPQRPSFRLHGWQRALAWWLLLSLLWAAAHQWHSGASLSLV